MTDIHIPPEAVEAVAWYLWRNGYTPHRDISENVARAAILAALKAWPDKVLYDWCGVDALILPPPLTQSTKENDNG